MARADKVWRLLPADPAGAQRLAREAGVSAVVAQLLLARQVADPHDARRFLDPALKDLHAPGDLPDVPAAADRLARAVRDGRKICVYGDYDADGVTGTAILLGLLQRLGAKVQFHVPLRLSEGYGLSCDKLGELARDGVSMVVSVDCGIASLDEATEAKRLGLELIVTDHHEMKTRDGRPDLPDAAVLVHPRLPGSKYPFDGLSGAGVALKLAWAVAQLASGGQKTSPELREYLLDAVGLAALGLVADVVPLRDENRILVRHGLARVKDKPSAGLAALMTASGLTEGKAITAEDVGFRLAPRINAAGRLGCARMAVDLLTTTNAARAKELAEYLDGLNTERQFKERKATDQAKEALDGGPHGGLAAIVIGSADWHPGVVGIVAGRLADHYGRPALVVALKDDGGVAVGSGRSVPGFPLHEALKACEEHLVGHGGHAAAAGFKLRPECLDAFRAAFAAHCATHFDGGPPPPPRLELDAEVPLSALTLGLLKDVDKLEPYGAANRRPLFLATNLTAEAVRKIGSADPQKHLDFRVRQGTTTMRAVAWNMADRMEELLSAGGAVCLAFTPKINEWRGERKVELHVTDFKPGREVVLG